MSPSLGALLRSLCNGALTASKSFALSVVASAERENERGAFSMTKRQWFIVLAALPAVTSPVFVSSEAYALDEVHTYGIANFGGTNQCGSSGMTHTVHTATASAFQSPFGFLKTLGLWDEISSRNNSLARGSYFTDSSKSATCTCSGVCSCVGDDMADDSGADDADVIYVHTHGGHNPKSPAYSSLSMGNASYDCSVRTDQNMQFGASGGDLDIAIIKACQSGDYDVWLNGGYRQQITTSSSSLTVWNAFHGDSSCGNHVTDYVADYSWSSIFNGVGENWLDEAYDSSGADDCPVSIVFGGSSSARVNMYEYGGFADRKNTGSKTGSTIFYIAGCDPDNGRTLPQ